MKKIFVLMLLSTSLLLQAQSLDSFVAKDGQSAKKIADSLALIAKRPFQYVSEYGDKGNVLYNWVVLYNEVGNKNNELSVWFRVKWIGANPSLEIKGTPEYVLDHVKGKFLDVFPFWKKYIDTTSNAVSMANAQFKKFKKVLDFHNDKELVYYLSEVDPETGTWEIRRYGL